MASPMKQWRKDHDVTQAALADLLFLYDHYGLSADFVLGINNLPSCEKAIT